MDQVHWKGQSQEEQKDITEAPPRISCPHRHCSRHPLLHLDCQAGCHPPLQVPRQGCVDLGHHWNIRELSKHTNIQCAHHLNNWSLPELYVNAVTVPKCPSSGESDSPGFWFELIFFCDIQFSLMQVGLRSELRLVFGLNSLKIFFCDFQFSLMQWDRDSPVSRRSRSTVARWGTNKMSRDPPDHFFYCFILAWSRS